MAPAAWRAVPAGLALRVRVTPRSGRDGIEGIGVAADGSSHLAVRVRAAPADGAANEAVRRVVAAALGQPAAAVQLVSGASGRIKTFAVQGDVGALVSRLQALAGGRPALPA